MRRSVISGVVALAMAVGAVTVARADDKSDSKDKTITGVLIDQACGKKMLSKDDPEKAAAGHPMACCSKESCAKSGYEVISGKECYKLDKESADQVKEYLGKDDSTTHVTVMGTTNDDGTLKVKSIEKAPEKKDEAK